MLLACSASNCMRQANTTAAEHACSVQQALMKQAWTWHAAPAWLGVHDLPRMGELPETPLDLHGCQDTETPVTRAQTVTSSSCMLHNVIVPPTSLQAPLRTLVSHLSVNSTKPGRVSGSSPAAACSAWASTRAVASPRLTACRRPVWLMLPAVWAATVPMRARLPPSDKVPAALPVSGCTLHSRVILLEQGCVSLPSALGRTS